MVILSLRIKCRSHFQRQEIGAWYYYLPTIYLNYWVIDMGRGGGSDGGHVVFEGLVSDLIKHADSKTGHHLCAISSHESLVRQCRRLPDGLRNRKKKISIKS